MTQFWLSIYFLFVSSETNIQADTLSPSLRLPILNFHFYNTFFGDIIVYPPPHPKKYIGKTHSKEKFIIKFDFKFFLKLIVHL